MLLPYQSRVFDSALTPSQALEHLKGAVEPKKWFRFRRAERPFEGMVEGSTFHIQRIIRYGNSFLPQLHGRVESTPNGRARVVVSFQLHSAVAVFMILWFGLITLFGAVAIWQSTISSDDLAPHLGIAVMLGFGAALLFGGFVPEAQRAACLLEGILNAQQSPV
jgi:hypothetical protein